jgi:hypothetical protein
MFFQEVSSSFALAARAARSRRALAARARGARSRLTRALENNKQTMVIFLERSEKITKWPFPS